MFQSVISRVNFPQVEEKILSFWKDKKIFEQSIDRRRGAPRFVLYEGPPTANGSPGIHHGIARVFKDIIPRYKAMKGYYTPRIAGWDTHGLPVELEIEKELGVPVIDPWAAAIRFAEMLVSLGLSHSKIAYMPPPPKRREV